MFIHERAGDLSCSRIKVLRAAALREEHILIVSP